MSGRWFPTLAILGGLLGPGAPAALACSCVMSGPSCQTVWSADAVFSGTVMSMTPIDHESLGAPYHSMLVTFNVVRGFVNAAAGPVEVVTGMGGGDCGYEFKVGVTYLVYASKNASSRLSTGICSRTRPLADARDDLEYLSTSGAATAGARVFGRVNEFRRDPAEESGADYGPVEGLTISVRGASFARDGVTDADGRFQIANLPVGRATVTIAVPFGYQPAAVEREIELKDPRACSQVDLTIYPLARASGFVTDASGRPLAGVEVDAVAQELAGFTPDQYQRPVKTDERGAFEFPDLPPGTYVFGINLTKDPGKRPRGQSVFLPGTTLARDATVVELKAGDSREVGVLRLSAPY